MPYPEKFRFRARGSALVTDYGAQDAGVRRFIGRRLNGQIGPAFVDRTTPGQPKRRHAVFEPLEEIDEIAWHDMHAHHYAAEVLAKNLWPADQATAEFCGVAFDPTFGGELEAEQQERDARKAQQVSAQVKPPAPAPVAAPAAASKGGA